VKSLDSEDPATSWCLPQRVNDNGRRPILGFHDQERKRFSLREARPGDQRVIRDLVHRERLNPFGLNWRHFIVAAAADGSIIGCGQIKTHGDGSRELASLVVRENWRGHGVGSAIVRRLAEDAPLPLWLMCRSELADYYRRFHFREVGADEPLPRYFRCARRLLGWPSRLMGRRRRLAIMVRTDR
jgi:N-acetylglutamate synthase-like GNAT family acetyltransferase